MRRPTGSVAGRCRMSRMMSKSAVRFARVALTVGQRALPAYAFRSRRDYTQPQLFALLALRQYLGLDYRTLVVRVAEWGELRRALRLTHVPHYSTLCYAAHRLEKKGASTGLWPLASPSPPPPIRHSPARRTRLPSTARA